MLFVLQGHVNGITSGTGVVSNDYPLFAKQGVSPAGFAHVTAANESNFESIGVAVAIFNLAFSQIFDRWQTATQFLAKVFDATCLAGGNYSWFAQT